MADKANTAGTGPTSKNSHAGSKSVNIQRVNPPHGMGKMTNSTEPGRKTITGLKFTPDTNMSPNVESAIKGMKFNPGRS